MKKEFKSSVYWDERYKYGGNSGSGSYGHLAQFKADFINDFLHENNIQKVIEFGSGDGNQIKYINYKNYIGFDISQCIIKKCKNIFKNDKNKIFKLYNEYNNEKADLTISLDVIFHLIEDEVYHDYMEKLFNASTKHVIIYSSNTNKQISTDVNHFKNRKFTQWIEKYKPDFKLIKSSKNKYSYKEYKDKGSVSDFFIYKIVTV